MQPTMLIMRTYDPSFRVRYDRDFQRHNTFKEGGCVLVLWSHDAYRTVMLMPKRVHMRANLL